MNVPANVIYLEPQKIFLKILFFRNKGKTLTLE